MIFLYKTTKKLLYITIYCNIFDNSIIKKMKLKNKAVKFSKKESKQSK